MSKITYALASLLLLTAACGAPPNPPGSLYPELILTRAERRREVEIKAARFLGLIRKEGLSGVLISGRPAFAWATAGAEGTVPLFYREDGRRYFIPRRDVDSPMQLDDLVAMGYEMRILSGSAQSEMTALLQGLSSGRPFGSDIPCSGGRNLDREIASLRATLTEGEARELRWLGRTTAESVEEVCRTVRPGMTDCGIEAALSDALLRHSVRVALVKIAPDTLVPGDDGKPRSDVTKIERQASVNLCAERWGLQVALTRIVHFGPLHEDEKANLEAAARVNAGFWARTLPGTRVQTILDGAMADYSDSGFPLQRFVRTPGGPIGYGEYGRGILDPAQSILTPQVFAWNALVGSVRVEDTILLDQDRMEVLTETPDWPRVGSEALGKIYRAPGILVYSSAPSQP
jgi:Xaa-Pro dipeptidase